jgi:hypothetical protein
MTTATSERQDQSGEHGIPANVHLIATARTLDGFALQLLDTDGVDVRELAESTIVVVRTRNSRYHLEVVEPETGRVLLSGGDRFPVPTEARLVGATSGGSMLRPGWIGVGLRVEFLQLRQRTTTSVVDAITIERTTTSVVDAITIERHS